MSVTLSLSQWGLGLGVLATLGFGGQSKEPQVKRAAQQPVPAVRPDQKLVIEPVEFAWADMVRVDASMPDWGGELLAPTARMPEPKALSIALPDDALGFRSAQPQSHIEPLVPCASVGAEPALGLSVAAQPDVPDSGLFSYIPPNVSGDVGPAHLMTMMNNQVRVQDRLGALISAVDLLAFWSPLGATATTWARVSYDKLSGRWVATVRYGANPAMAIGFAISDTNDPTGSWDFYSIPANDGGTRFPDWIPHGTSTNWITITASMFNIAGGTLAGIQMWVIDMASALDGSPITVSNFVTGFMAGVTTGATPTNSLWPCTQLDTSISEMWLMNNNFGSAATAPAVSTRLLQLAKISGTGAAPVVSPVLGSPFGATASLCFVSTNTVTTILTMAQVGDARFITPLSIRLMGGVTRNGKIWVSHVGGLPLTNPATTNRTVAVWHQVDPTLPFPASPGAPGTMIVQSNSIDGGTGACIAYPSISVSCGDDALIGFSRGDNTRNPECGYVYRVGSDPLGAQGPLQLLKAGDSSYWKNFGVGTTAQWGFHSSTGTDPNDDKTLWTLQEYAALRVGAADNDSRWGTWWGRLGDCETLPVITDEPDSVTGCIGDPVTFTVAATTGANPLSYQWRKDGVDISGETATTLSFPTTVVGDAGVYDVVVTGCGSVISLPATLAFLQPNITTQPVDVEASRGDPASFFVVASGTGTLSYQWQHNEVDIPLATSDTYSIASVVVGDFGRYRCIVTDDCGPAPSDTARLTYQKRGNNFGLGEFNVQVLHDPENAIGCVGQPTTFTVDALPEDATYVWRYNGVPIVPSETNSSLTIASVAPGDAGSYDVVVTKGSTSVTSGAATLTVNDVPVITSHPSNQTTTVGGSASFTVVATGDGELEYQWRRQVTPNGPWTIVPGATEPTLVISPVNGSNAGRYRCHVSNHCGQVISNSARLTVQF